MIYLVHGDDFEKRSTYIKTIIGNTSVVRIPAQNLSAGLITNYCEQNSLFGDIFSVILENPFSESTFLVDELLIQMKESETVFIILEEKINAKDLKRYQKFCEGVEKFEIKKEHFVQKENPFILANMYGMKNKIATWIEYRKQIEKGNGGAEPIAGMLFWKIKSMTISGNSKFSQKELKKQSSELVDIYHNAHLGSLDMDIALEQFILKNL